MSVEPTTLERSALERKDREELTTIAQALGGQIRPRARKAEIVQLILELTGVETPEVAPDGGAPVSDPKPEAPAEPAAAAEAPASPEPAQKTGESPEAAVTEAPAAESSTSDSTAAEPETKRSDKGDEGSKTNGKTEARSDGRSNQRGEPRNGQKNDKGGNKSNKDDQGEQVDVAEPGNRRRRRRGRNRGSEGTHVEEYTGEPVEVEGLLDLRDEGYGFLRVKGSLPSKDDIYVSVKQARQIGRAHV